MLNTADCKKPSLGVEEKGPAFVGETGIDVMWGDKIGRCDMAGLRNSARSNVRPRVRRYCALAVFEPEQAPGVI